MEVTKKDINKMLDILDHEDIPLPYDTHVSCGLDQLYNLRGCARRPDSHRNWVDRRDVPEKKFFEKVWHVYRVHTGLDAKSIEDIEEESEYSDFEVDPAGYGVDSASYRDFSGGPTTGFLLSDAVKNSKKLGSAIRFVQFLRKKGERVYDCGPPHVNRNTGNVIQHWLWLPHSVEVKG